MTEWEKELEELVHRIVLKTFNEYREQLIETIAKYLTEEGYTKKHFPVEKLIKWLEEDTQTRELKSIIKAKGVDCFSGLGLNVGLGVISIVIRLAFDTVANKIKELEDET